MSKNLKFDNDLESMFRADLERDINLFCGAGFSVLAGNKGNPSLPVGNVFLEILKKSFPSVANFSNLPRACSTVESTDKASFYALIRDIFSVQKFDSLYLELLKLSISHIYTTNVDDLWFKIFEDKTSKKVLHDASEKGANYNGNSDNTVIYYPLHGCVRHKQEKYVFSATDIVSTFSTERKRDSWKSLANDCKENPILFWGWNFTDSGPIESMYSGQNQTDSNTHKWFLVYDTNGRAENSEMAIFLRSLNFNLIFGETKDLLEYIKEFNNSRKNDAEYNSIDKEYLKKRYVPTEKEKSASYQFSDYFLEYTPRWCYVYKDAIYKTSHYQKIENEIAANKNVVVIGMKATGKTTLMMQLFKDCFSGYRVKHFLIAPTNEDAKLYLQFVDGNRTLLFVDDCFRDSDAMVTLLSAKNVQVVGFERDFNYERQCYKIEKFKIKLMEITNIEQRDAQKILDSIPEKLKRKNSSTKNFEKDPTILNFLATVLTGRNFKFMPDFYKKDEIAAKVFLLICYVHYCGVPCSFDMVYSYLGDEDYHWSEMLDAVNRSGKLVRDYQFSRTPKELVEDYYQCRSQFFAEKIIESISNGSETFKDFLWNFVEKVPVYKICDYDKFAKTGYDADKIIYKAFCNDIEEGEKFIEECIRKDENEYMYQQAALYFSKMKNYEKAFSYIEKAEHIDYHNHFSIQSTYARIFFDANLNQNKNEALKALGMLDECCRNDKRRAIHFIQFINNILRFLEVYSKEGESNDIEYLIDNAFKYADEGLSDENISLSWKHKKELRKLKEKLEKHIQR